MLPRARGNLGAVYIFEGLGKELLGWLKQFHLLTKILHGFLQLQ